MGAVRLDLAGSNFEFVSNPYSFRFVPISVLSRYLFACIGNYIVDAIRCAFLFDLTSPSLRCYSYLSSNVTSRDFLECQFERTSVAFRLLFVFTSVPLQRHFGLHCRSRTEMMLKSLHAQSEQNPNAKSFELRQNHKSTSRCFLCHVALASLRVPPMPFSANFGNHCNATSVIILFALQHPQPLNFKVIHGCVSSSLQHQRIGMLSIDRELIITKVLYVAFGIQLASYKCTECLN